jgi:integrase
MSVYRPTYKDPKTGKTKQQKVWWYHFQFAGRHIQESTKSTRKTIAVESEKKRRLALENAFNDTTDRRKERIRTIEDLASTFLGDYQIRKPRSATFAEYALKHLKRHLGKSMTVDMNEAAIKEYQTLRLKEKASAKSINEEVVFLLRLLGEQGDFIRAKLKRANDLKLATGRQIAKAFTVEDKEALLKEAKARRSPSVYPALMLALHAGMRDAELRGLQWGRVDLQKAIIAIADAKTEAGEGRTIPLNADALAALVDHFRWFLQKFGETRPEWYLFPFGQPQPVDPTRPVTSFKGSWTEIRKKTGVMGRWHDNRHTWVTDLAESGEASDETIQELAGHVSKRMLKHYSHIRMQAKRRAVDALVKKPISAVVEAAPVIVSDLVVRKGQTDHAKESAKVAVLN